MQTEQLTDSELAILLGAERNTEFLQVLETPCGNSHPKSMWVELMNQFIVSFCYPECKVRVVAVHELAYPPNADLVWDVVNAYTNC